MKKLIMASALMAFCVTAGPTLQGFEFSERAGERPNLYERNKRELRWKAERRNYYGEPRQSSQSYPGSYYQQYRGERQYQAQQFPGRYRGGAGPYHERPRWVNGVPEFYRGGVPEAGPINEPVEEWE